MTKDKKYSNTSVLTEKKNYQLDRQHYLDTLEVTSDLFKTKSHESLYRSTLQKHNTLTKLVQIIDVAPIERKKKYWKTYHCKNVLLQDGNNLIGSLCRKRWCQTCNRIKTAEMTNSYKQPLLDFGDLYLVTLTRPNVKGRQLKSECKKLIKGFQHIKDNLRKNYKLRLNGMRKLEVTYNVITDEYHPHFHFILQGKHEAEMLQMLWLKQFNTANIKAQDITRINTGNEASFIEVFKYASKDIVKDSTTATAQDIIYKSIEGLRIYQPFGKLKKVEAPKEAKDESHNADFIPPTQEIYVYDKERIDYVNAKNEVLIGTTEIMKTATNGKESKNTKTKTKSEVGTSEYSLNC